MLFHILARLLWPKWSLFANMWESMQVELHGIYSTARVLQLAKHERTSNWIHDIAILFGIPLPCVAVTVLIDVFPLADPTDSIDANTMSFVRVYYSFVVFSLVATHLVRTVMPSRSFTVIRALLNALVISAITVCILYGMTRSIGFPLPFSVLTVSPAWTVLTAIFVVVEWAAQIRSNPDTQQAVITLIKLWICDALMVFIYPAFFYIFTTLSLDGQRAFALLLPVIKLIMRNLFARVTVHFSDATPEFVVFHAEVFNSLFMSYCMQKSPSIWTTLQITIADALLTVVSLRDIESARRGLKSLERRIDKKKGWGRFHNSAQNGRYLEQTTLDRASTLLQQNENQENTRISSTADIVRIASFCDRVLNDAKAEGEEVDTRKTVVMPKNMDPSSSLAGGMVRATGVAVHPISNDRTDIGSSNMSITLRYTCKVRRLLYMAEFLVLLNYVEVFIPLVFSLNTLATYHLPNRTYYPAFDGMDEHQLMQTLQNGTITVSSLLG
ncbi:hypothetical protein L916_12424 [Phytophthora nicotianae]|uniref:Uncharacterized protein n=1 Tax=Phytophthora nicotianae TaxID=4792 RepID=W2IPJ1_PHYNI|nr:hypothetical protein L916_12424 [Phytophthora nicotianae]